MDKAGLLASEAWGGPDDMGLRGLEEGQRTRLADLGFCPLATMEAALRASSLA